MGGAGRPREQRGGGRGREVRVGGEEGAEEGRAQARRLTALGQTPASLLTHCVTLGKSRHLSGPQFS